MSSLGIHTPLALTGAVALVFTAAQEFVPWDLAEPAPAVALRPSVLPELESYSCATCHAEVAREWAATAHGLSWIDEVYQEAVKDKRRPESCYGCHAPEPVLLEQNLARPKVREGDRRLGISCESCHAGAGGVVFGPRGTPVDAHPSEASPRMTSPGSNELCSACHSTNIGPVIGIAKDFAASDQASRGRSCVGCHMAPVERAWASGDSVPTRAGRSHALQTPRDPSFLRRAFAVSWRTDGAKSRVVVENQAGHRVPGLIGREIRFKAELLDESKSVIERAELRLDATAYLPVDGTTEIPLKQAGAAVRLLGEHLDPRDEKPVVFLDEQLEPSDH